MPTHEQRVLDALTNRPWVYSEEALEDFTRHDSTRWTRAIRAKADEVLRKRIAARRKIQEKTWIKKDAFALKI